MEVNISTTEQELYYLIARFLDKGPCNRTAQVLREELLTHKLLPARRDWMGNDHCRSLEEMNDFHPHISDNFLLKICARVPLLLEKSIPASVKGVHGLLGAGQQCLLRNEKGPPKALNTVVLEAATVHNAVILPPVQAAPSNLATVATARALHGRSIGRKVMVTCNIFSKATLHKRILGHLASVYCMLFDRTGYLIATGADDQLVKLWSTVDGRLIATLRGHSGEITDLAINCENTLIASGSCDKTIRVWSLKNTAPVAVLQGHTGMITSLQFSPSPVEEMRYLVSSGGDGAMCFWKWNLKTNEFNLTPIKFNEKSRPGAQMLCLSFSPGGNFLVSGSSDNIIRIYQISSGTPEKMAEISAHTDHVDSIQFSHGGNRFITGSRDGTAMVWYFQRSEWKKILLNGYQTLKPLLVEEQPEKPTKLRVTMVCWSLTDQYVITAVSNHTLKVWNPNNGELLNVLSGHNDEVFVLINHPREPSLLLSAGHDGSIILWNLLHGTIVNRFFNLLEGQGHGAVFDCRFSPDGTRFAATDSHGHLCIFGLGSSEPYDLSPYEQFFHTDFRPLIRDSNNYVLDEQTQMAPHLMPPPFLVDVDGNPHTAEVQFLIPGRNVNNLPQRRVAPSTPRVDLPPLLAEIEEAEAALAASENGLLSPSHNGQPPPVARSPLQSPGGGSRLGLRQSGNVEGVRHVPSNLYVCQDITAAEQEAWRNRRITLDMDPVLFKLDEECRLQQSKEEVQRYFKERKKKPLTAAQRMAQAKLAEPEKPKLRKRTTRGRVQRNVQPPRALNNYYSMRNSRATRERGDSDLDVGTVTSDSEFDDDWDSRSSSSGSSSECSDWTEEVGLHEQKDSKKRRARRLLSTDDEEEEREGKEKEERGNKLDAEAAGSPSKSKDKKSKPKKSRKKESIKPKFKDAEEMVTFYQPPEWITMTVPRKSPYYPQVGDEVYYFKQGHELYVKAVVKERLYEINPKKQCYVKLDLKPEELCRVCNCVFTPGTPRLCTLKLAILNPETGANTGGSFTVKYHDMPDILDFIVLQQHYRQAVERDWKQGDRFRCEIDDSWWYGSVAGRSPFDPQYQDSLFLCLHVNWDTGEEERMSPWDLEPVNEDDPGISSVGATTPTPLTEEDRHYFEYIPNDSDWPSEGRDAAVQRIANGLELLCAIPVAGPFAYPVDVKSYPSYWSVVAIPTDLNSIKERLVNFFYRRRSALLWEVGLIAYNTKSFNEEDSEICKNSILVKKILTRFIKDTTCTDILALYSEYQDEVVGLDESAEDHENDTAEEEDSGSRRRKMQRSSRRRAAEAELPKLFEQGSSRAGQSWSSAALDLLDFIFSLEDSVPFREPVDTTEYTDYLEIVQETMDLGIVRQRLMSNQYSDPDSFARDMRLIFTNSRRYNTNTRSRIYGMTLRLSALFETRADSILRNYHYQSSGRGDERQTRRRTKQMLDESRQSSSSRSTASSSLTSATDTTHSSAGRSALQRYSGSGNVSGSGSGSGRKGNLRLFVRRNNSTYSTEYDATVDVENDSDSESVESPSRDLDGKTGVAINLRTGKSRNIGTSVVPSSPSKSKDPVQSSSNPHRTRLATRREASGSGSSTVDQDTHGLRNRNGMHRVPALHKKALYQSDSEDELSDKESSEDEEEDEEEEEEDEEEIENGSTGRGRSNSFGDDDNVDDEDNEDDEDEEEEKEDDDDADSDSDMTFDSNSRSSRSRTRNRLKRAPSVSSDHVLRSSSRKRRRLSSANEQNGVLDDDSNHSVSKRPTRKRATVCYRETTEDEEAEDNSVAGVSSRGRVRKAATRYADFVN